MEKILIVIDPQNDFCTEGGSLSNPETERVAKVLARYISENEFDKIYVTADTHQEDYMDTLEGKKLPIPHCKRGEWGWLVNDDVMRSLSQKQNVHSVEKQTFGFIGWDNLVRKQAEREFTVVGFCTDICVVANALILRTLFPNTKISVVANCCAGTSNERHLSALSVMNSCQIDIV